MTRKIKLKKTIVLMAMMMLSGCGTLFGGINETLSFDSNVEGTQIYLNGMKACKTPCTYQLKKKMSTVVVMAKKEGYETQQEFFDSEFNPVVLGNMFSLGSWVTDAVSGGMWQYSRNAFYIEMEPKAGTMEEEKSEKKRVTTK